MKKLREYELIHTHMPNMSINRKYKLLYKLLHMFEKPYQENACSFSMSLWWLVPAYRNMHEMHTPIHHLAHLPSLHLFEKTA